MIAGILLAIYNDLTSSIWGLLFSISFTTNVILLLISKKRPALNKELLFGGVLYLTIFLGGVNIVIFKTSKNDPLHYQKFNLSSEEYIIQVTELPKEKPNSIQVIAEVQQVIDSSLQVTKTNGLVLLYFAKDSLSTQILQGDKLIISSLLNDINEPVNPGQFNYKLYLSFNQIYQQGYVQEGNFEKIDSESFGIMKFAAQCRNDLLSILKENGLAGDELAVASALILGYKDDLGDELKHSYSSAGATHVLAVSGLHVGIIYLVLNFLFSLFDKNDKYNVTKSLLLILALWAYATLTGLSPSVMRAATMFSFVAAGGIFKKKTSTYNTLATSAFVLLIYNPYLIMEVGFQLSYLAVLGIVYFQSIIYKRIYFKRKLPDYIWKITSVSIAAQLTTFPLGLLYFHQFPSYFFISNLVVIPGAMFIIGLGIAIFIFGAIPYVGTFLGLVLSKFILLMNSFIISIDTLPYSLIEGISISIKECWLIYVIIILFVISYESRKMKFTLLSLIGIIIFISADLIEDFQIRSHKEITIYQIKGEPNINFISQGNHIFISDPSLIKNKSTMLFNIHHHWFDLDLPQPKTYNFSDSIENNNLIGSSNYYQFHNTTLYHLVSDDFPVIPNPIDILYMSTSEKIDITELMNSITPKIIVVGNNCNWQVRKNLAQLSQRDITIHFLKDKGAFIFPFS